MTREQYQRVKAIVQLAWDQPPESRDAYVDETCGTDPDLRSLVVRLLSADQDAGSFLEVHPKPEVAAVAAENAESSCGHIGPYRILREIGRGGMGIVYLAERADGHYRKQVALKVMNPDFGAAAILRRFRTERQVLAALEHPCIAQLQDGGESEDGHPYLVMEYVEGERIDTWCDRRQLSVQKRLSLMRQVCAGVQYAHERQVIHRDLKPDNILVTAEGTPKLLDFGIAKVLNPDFSPDRGQITETTNGPAPMTPEYASPEQVLGERVGPASDVYSLGVVLYRLLTGRAPFEFQGRDLREITAAICEREPVRPSEAILGRAPQDRDMRSRISHDRSESPSSLRRRLTGDLDNIVLKTLRKEPERRYHSAAELADDLDRFLQDLPVRARRESLRYRAQKFAKRNRAFAWVAAFSAVLAITATLASHQAFAPNKASIAILPLKDLSPEQDQEYFSEGIAEELVNQLVRIPGIRVSPITTVKRLKASAADHDIFRAKLHVATYLEGSVRAQETKLRIVVRLIRTEDGFAVWSETYDRARSEIADVEEAIVRQVAASLKVNLPRMKMERTNLEAHNAFLQGQYFLSSARADKAVGYFEQSIRLDPNYASAWASLAEARIFQAGLSIPSADGYRLARDAVSRAMALDPVLADAHAILAEIQAFHDWDWTAAKMSSQRALNLKPGDPGIIDVAAGLARVLGRFDEAIKLQRQSLEIDPLHTNAYKNLGMALYYVGRSEEARSNLNKVLEQIPDASIAHFYLSQVDLMQSRAADAFDEAHKVRFSPFRLASLALAAHALGRRKESQGYLDELTAKHASEVPYLIAEVYSFVGERDKAFQWLERAYTLRDDWLPEIKGDPLLRLQRGDERYSNLLKRLGLPL